MSVLYVVHQHEAQHPNHVNIVDNDSYRCTQETCNWLHVSWQYDSGPITFATWHLRKSSSNSDLILSLRIFVLISFRNPIMKKLMR